MCVDVLNRKKMILEYINHKIQGLINVRGDKLKRDGALGKRTTMSVLRGAWRGAGQTLEGDKCLPLGRWLLGKGH